MVPCALKEQHGTDPGKPANLVPHRLDADWGSIIWVVEFRLQLLLLGQSGSRATRIRRVMGRVRRVYVVAKSITRN